MKRILTAALITATAFLSGGRAIAANAGLATTHPNGVLTKDAEAAVATKYLLVRQGTAANQVLIGTAADKPLGIAQSTAAADELLTVHALGASQDTQLVIAGGTIARGDRVYTAASGKVTAISATPGTYWMVGEALTGGSSNAVIEILPCLPVQTVVIAALTVATPAATAATSSTPFGYSEAQANAILTNVREMRAALISHGLIADNA